jgi:parvulin-like peptidyl-prolyl isomerase
MGRRLWVCAVWCLVSVPAFVGCHREQRATPPPDVARPVIKSEVELAAERAERIRAGEIIATSSPALVSADRAKAARREPERLEPTPGAIQGDILLVNDAVLTVSEVLYPLRGRLEDLRQNRTRPGFLEEARRLIKRKTQEEIGSLLIHAEATAKLDQEQKKSLDAAVDKELETQTAREFGGSVARLESHLKQYGLTRDQIRTNLRRSMVVRQYTREKLMPQVQVRRDELLSEYRRNAARYSTPESRELLLIELPFEKFLPAGQTWDNTGPAERAQAKLKAMRRAREARAALAEKPFADVAGEYSLGSHADAGGSWGMLGRPLQAPYETLSKLIFEYAEGQTSDAIETDTGWYIVGCGRVEAAHQAPFVDVQDKIRAELMDRRFDKLSIEYVLRLAEKATISSLDAFVNTAVERADKLVVAAKE